MKKLLLILFFVAGYGTLLFSQSKDPDFVYIHEIIPGIQYDIRYYTTDNFMGKQVDGYNNPVALLTREVVIALKKVQENLKKQGLGLKVFDAYRPQKAVDHFIRWANVMEDTLTKRIYYPDIDKKDLFELGYISEKSGHTRGSTLDLTIIDLATKKELDMGSRWDFFGDISHHGTTLISDQQTANRNMLLQVMKKHGFRPYANEWWHYTLEDEPFPDTYFDFDVE